MDLLKSIHELEELVANASHFPFTGKCMLDEEALMQLISDMREQWPTALQEAEKITDERDKIIEDARAEAKNIIEQAKAYAQKQVSEDAITTAAKARANEILEKTYQRSEEVRNGSLQYAQQVFEHMEHYMKNVMDNVSMAKEGLKHIDDVPKNQHSEEEQPQENNKQMIKS